MSPQELEQIAQNHGVDVSKLQVINSEGQMLPHKRISEKSRIQAETATNLTAVGQEELQGGVDENGIPRSPADGQHRMEAAKVNAALSPVMQKIAAIQKVEEEQGVRADFQRAELGELLDQFKVVTDDFNRVDDAYKAQRSQLYQDALTQEFTPVLRQNGFTAQEAAVTVQAISKTALEAEGNMSNNPHFANGYATQLVAAYQQSNFDYSAYKPDANKIEDAVGKAFNAKMVAAMDGDLSIKGQTPNFRMRQAEQFTAEAAQQAGLTLQPKTAPHQSMEPKAVYHVAGSVTASRGGAGAAQQAQASETFKITSEGPMNDDGQQVAFAKRALGARTAELHLGAQDEVAIMKSKIKDSEQIGTVAPLFGTTDAVNEADQMNPDAKKAALGGSVDTLPARSVASSAVNEALGMKSVAKEAVGVDTDGRVVGVSVVAPGVPMLKRPDENDPHEAFLNVDYADADIQKGLYDLEAQDYITGQIDRHPGNIFIDPNTKQVTGIDNDLAFPTVDRNQMIAGNGGLAAKAAQGMPALMHADTADRIEAMKPEDLRRTLENLKVPGGVPGLEPAAIDGAVHRLQELQQEIKNMRAEGRVVSEFTPAHYEAARKAQIEKTNSPDIGSQGNYAATRTSYVGSAVLLEARTAALNDPGREEYREYNKRTITDPATVPPFQVSNPQFAEYKAAVEAAKQDLATNVHKVPSMEMGGQIKREVNAVNALEQQLAAQTQTMQERTAALRTAEQAPIMGRNRAVAAAKTSLNQVLDERKQTLQDLATAKTRLNATLDQAVEPMKPQMHRRAGLSALGAKVADAQNEVAQCQQRVNDLGDVKMAGGHREAQVRQQANDALVAAQEKARQAQAKLDRFDQTTANAQVPEKESVGESLGRGRSNSSVTLRNAPDVGPAAGDGGWTKVKPSENPDKKSTRAAFGQQRGANQEGPAVAPDRTHARSKSVG